MIFPKKMNLSDRLACWFTFSCIGFFAFMFIIINSGSNYYRPTLLQFTLSGALFVWLYGNVFFTVDYYFRRASEVARWAAILIISGLFFLFWGSAGELITLYLNWFSGNPANAAGVTSLALGLLLFCGIVSNRSFPLLAKYWNKRRKEAKA
ncbi:MAG: hypothetical protein E3J82_06085 [Candidatus Thorarchaeota archaeon]|nr:MAG: hypothetical protein E3J82_06085 [Candidatus Thorarchaeota archaeon]